MEQINKPITYKSFAKNFKIVCEPNVEYMKKVQVRSSADIVQFVRELYNNANDIEVVESFYILLLNRNNIITGWVKTSSGGITNTVADPVIICKYAIEQLAQSVILAHNHPSGSTKPSTADERVTKNIKACLSLFDIKLLDHIIMTEDSHLSFADEGLLF